MNGPMQCGDKFPFIPNKLLFSEVKLWEKRNHLLRSLMLIIQDLYNSCTSFEMSEVCLVLSKYF